MGVVDEVIRPADVRKRLVTVF
jgi:hypothetical protein